MEIVRRFTRSQEVRLSSVPPPSIPHPTCLVSQLHCCLRLPAVWCAVELHVIDIWTPDGQMKTVKRTHILNCFSQCSYDMQRSL